MHGPYIFRIFYKAYNDKKGDVERRITMITIAAIIAVLLISYELVVGLIRIAMEGL